MDSTYLVQKLLKEGNRVEAFYIDIKNNVEKGQRERAAIEKMLPFFNGKDFSFKRLVSIEMFDSSVRLRRDSCPSLSLARCIFMDLCLLAWSRTKS